jgi:hypothetical protein
MIRLIALSVKDGWAFIDTGGRTQLVRPPYELMDLIEVIQFDVSRAIQYHGFTAADVSFSNWSSLISYLNDGVIRDESLPYEKTICIISSASKRSIEKYVFRIENELVSSGEIEMAWRILTLMRSLQVVKDDLSLLCRITSLQSRCRC